MLSPFESARIGAALTPRIPCMEICSCNLPLRLTMPTSESWERCGMRWTGRGAVTSTTDLTGNANHSSRRSKDQHALTGAVDLRHRGVKDRRFFKIAGRCGAIEERPRSSASNTGNCDRGRAGRVRGSFDRRRCRSGSSSRRRRGRAVVIAEPLHRPRGGRGGGNSWPKLRHLDAARRPKETKRFRDDWDRDTRISRSNVRPSPGRLARRIVPNRNNRGGVGLDCSINISHMAAASSCRP